ncbi:MAG: ABC transporter permease [Saccharofermentanales bacterium]|jgi:ABC-type dipeptide/oligopeptide/nickel transport system permease component
MSIPKRLIGFVIVLIGVSILSFSLSAISGVDPAEAIARHQIFNASPELIERIREEYNLDRSIVERYFSWMSGILKGDFGISYMSHNAVRDDIASLLPKTLALSGLSLTLIIVVALPVGALCAQYHNGIFDQIMRWVTVFGICIPIFWLGFLLLLMFAVKVPLFKVVPEPGLKGYILPAISLAMPSMCTAIRLFRSSLLTELSADYVAFLYSRGQSKSRVLWAHAFRNALPPMITLFASYAGALIAGSAIVESIFSIKGFGSYLIKAVVARDLPVISASVLIVASIFVLLNLFADITNRLLCPRTALKEDADA